MEHREVVDTWFRRVWREEDESAIDEMMVSETVARGLQSSDRVGPEEFKQFHRAFLAIVGDVEVLVDKQSVDGNFVWSLITLNCRSRASGEQISISGQICAEIADSKIVDAHNHIDFISLFEKLGVMPHASLDRCLSGQALT